MGRLADRLDALTVRVLSPDRHIHGELRERNRIDVSFADDELYYGYRSERELASQLSFVVNALLVGRFDGFRAAVRDVTDLALDDAPHWDAQRRRFREERDGTLLEGRSVNELVRVLSTGLRDARVSVEAGALSDLDAPEFMLEVQSAIADLWDDYSFVMDHLRRKHFGNLNQLLGRAHLVSRHLLGEVFRYAVSCDERAAAWGAAA